MVYVWGQARDMEDCVVFNKKEKHENMRSLSLGFSKLLWDWKVANGTQRRTIFPAAVLLGGKQKATGRPRKIITFRLLQVRWPLNQKFAAAVTSQQNRNKMQIGPNYQHLFISTAYIIICFSWGEGAMHFESLGSHSGTHYEFYFVGQAFNLLVRFVGVCLQINGKC